MPVAKTMDVNLVMPINIGGGDTNNQGTPTKNQPTALKPHLTSL